MVGISKSTSFLGCGRYIELSECRGGEPTNRTGRGHRATQPPMEGFKVKCTRNSGLNYVLGFLNYVCIRNIIGFYPEDVFFSF